MKIVLVILSLAVFSNAHGLVRPSTSRILNGEDADVGKIPYQVSLQHVANSMHFCGGVILNKNYVLTTAFCVTRKSSAGIKVVASTVDLSLPVETYMVEEIIVHEAYNQYQDVIKNDIALLKVKTAFKVSANLDFVPMPNASMVISAGTPAVVSGWGTLTPGADTLPKHLQRADIFIADQTNCILTYLLLGYTVRDTNLCANDPRNGKGACRGDAGSPLTVNGELVGLVSFSVGCSAWRYPQVYTRVSEYVNWINSHAI